MPKFVTGYEVADPSGLNGHLLQKNTAKVQSSVFQPDYPNYSSILTILRALQSQVTFGDLLAYTAALTLMKTSIGCSVTKRFPIPKLLQLQKTEKGKVT